MSGAEPRDKSRCNEGMFRIGYGSVGVHKSKNRTLMMQVTPPRGVPPSGVEVLQRAAQHLIALERG